VTPPSPSHPLAIVGRVAFVVTVGAVVVLSFLGAPHLLYSYHVAHFAAFYILSLTALAAFPGWSFLRAFWALTAFLTVVALFRVVLDHHAQTTFLDWISDLGGVFGAMAPMLVQRFREGFKPARPE
jgi:hypothetical protein